MAVRRKPTRAQRVVLEVLRQANDHPDALAIHARAGRIDTKLCRASIYRALTSLQARGLIRRHLFDGTRAVWEMVRAQRHAHLIDVASGAILEIPAADLLRSHEAAAAALGYRLTDARIQLYGERVKS